MHKTLLLRETDIQKLLTPRECFLAVKRAFRSHGLQKTILPAKIYIELPKRVGDFRAMPAFLEDPPRAGIKWVNVHPGNRQKKLPTVMGIIVLSDTQTGFPLAIMDGTYITKMRTGAGGAVAAQYLARKDSKIVGLVGCGVQAETQLLFLLEIFQLTQINYWGLTPKDRRRFQKRFPKLLNLQACTNIREVVFNADIVVTTTPTRKPLLRMPWIQPGTHINAIGADAKGKQELEAGILKKGKLVVDDWEQASESGEMNVPYARGELKKRNVYGTLGEIVCGFKKGRVRPDEITIFDATGLAIQDVAVAWEVYKKARAYGQGKSIQFF